MRYSKFTAAAGSKVEAIRTFERRCASSWLEVVGTNGHINGLIAMDGGELLVVVLLFVVCWFLVVDFFFVWAKLYPKSPECMVYLPTFGIIWVVLGR